jgi:hypothetical protein
MPSITTTLAAAPAKVSAGDAATIGGTMLIFIAASLLIWYCVKHKGWDVPQLIMGYAFGLIVGGVSWGAQLNDAFSGAISSGMGALVKAVSKMG